MLRRYAFGGLLAIAIASLSLGYPQSFSLTEAVDLFGNTNSIDLILNDIWLEPQNPKEGDTVSIKGSVYNAGVVDTGSASNVVTIGYVVNGALAEISLLENMSPGIENGRVISSGPILDAVPGKHEVIVILNYHDTLSHLRDNPSNNIVQKTFEIKSEEADEPLIISSEVFQSYNNMKDEQIIKIEGEVTDIFQEKQNDKEITIKINDASHGKAITNAAGEFSFKTSIPYSEEIIEVTIHLENESHIAEKKEIFPVKLGEDESIFALEIISDSPRWDLNEKEIIMAIFQESYDDESPQIISNEDGNKKQFQKNNFLLTTLSGNQEYIIETYIEGRFLDAIQDNFSNNIVVKRSMPLVESAKVQFKVLDEEGNPESGILVDNWVYSGTSNSQGMTEIISVLPNFLDSEPYVANVTFSDGTTAFSEGFTLKDGDFEVIKIIKDAIKGEQK